MYAMALLVPLGACRMRSIFASSLPVVQSPMHRLGALGTRSCAFSFPRTWEGLREAARASLYYPGDVMIQDGQRQISSCSYNNMITTRVTFCILTPGGHPGYLLLVLLRLGPVTCAISPRSQIPLLVVLVRKYVGKSGVYLAEEVTPQE